MRGSISMSTRGSSVGMKTQNASLSSSKMFPKYLVKEHFNQANPPGWKEIGELATYDAINKNVEIESIWKLTTDRYSKEHPDLRIDSDFSFEFKYKRIINVEEASMVMLGDFNKNNNNRTNFIGVRLTMNLLPPEMMPYYTISLLVYYNDGTEAFETIHGAGPNLNQDYMFKGSYSKASRILNGKIYTGVGFNTLQGEGNLSLSEVKTFTTNDFGVGNRDIFDDPTLIYKIDYDDAILTIPGSQSISKNLIATRKNIGTIKGGKVSGSISYQ